MLSQPPDPEAEKASRGLVGEAPTPPPPEPRAQQLSYNRSFNSNKKITLKHKA